jgi:hypothetical protein
MGQERTLLTYSAGQVQRHSDLLSALKPLGCIQAWLRALDVGELNRGGEQFGAGQVSKAFPVERPAERKIGRGEVANAVGCVPGVHDSQVVLGELVWDVSLGGFQLIPQGGQALNGLADVRAGTRTLQAPDRRLQHVVRGRSHIKDPGHGLGTVAGHREVVTSDSDVNGGARLSGQVDVYVPRIGHVLPPLVRELAADGVPVAVASRVLNISRSGYYDWLGRPESPRALRNKEVTKMIAEIHADSRSSYGSPRVCAGLRLGLGIEVNRKRVERLMRQAGIQGVYRRKGRRNLVNAATEDDLVRRQFTVAAPDRLWLADITEHPAGDGKLYCAAVPSDSAMRVCGWRRRPRGRWPAG